MVRCQISDRMLILAISDSEETFTQSTAIPILETKADDAGQVAVIQDCERPLGFEWSLSVEPEFDMPFLPDEQPLWWGTDIYLRRIAFADKRNLDDAVVEVVSDLEGQPSKQAPIPIYPISDCLSLHFDRDGYYKHGGFSVTLPDRGRREPFDR